MRARSKDGESLERFVAAQRDVHAHALAEIRAGAKRGHWMWFVFPQLVGLGHSEMARYYGIASLEEARAYLAHPILGERLRTCVAAIPDRSPDTVFGAVDAMKLRSCLTLFEQAGGDAGFGQALDRLFGGERDHATLRLLDGAASSNV